MKVTASETIYYVMGGQYSSVSGWKKLYVNLGSQKLVEYSNGVTYFFHADRLGTPKTQTDTQGATVETWDNYPYGEQWLQTGGAGNEHRYTGHLRDTESGNDYAGARYYSNIRARWLSVDPVLGDTSDPQQLNRYKYALNDPVNYWDPASETPPWVQPPSRPGRDPSTPKKPGGPGVMLPVPPEENRLSDCVRNLLSDFFSGIDLSAIRVHTDGVPAWVKFFNPTAKGFGWGNDIYFDEYDPHTLAGIKDIAHELVHAEQSARFGQLFADKYLFGLLYLQEHVERLSRGSRGWAAYYTNMFEREARRRAKYIAEQIEQTGGQEPCPKNSEE